MFLLRVIEAFNNNGVNYAVAGGYALALHGVVRGTVDIDFVIPLTEADFILVEKTLRGIGLEPKLPVDAKTIFSFREEYIKNKNLVAWSFFNPKLPSEIVDVIITCDLAKMNFVTIDISGRNVNIVSADELIKMKKNSGRPQDVEDVRALEYVKEFK